MKKIVIILLVLCCLAGCSGYKGKIQTKTASELLQMYENKETFVVYAGQGGCDSCVEYVETLHELMKEYDLTIYYFSVDNEKNEDLKNTLIYDYFYRLLWTPTTYVVVEGKTKDMIENSVQYDELVGWLKKYGILSD